MVLFPLTPHRLKQLRGLLGPLLLFCSWELLTPDRAQVEWTGTLHILFCRDALALCIVERNQHTHILPAWFADALHDWLVPGYALTVPIFQEGAQDWHWQTLTRLIISRGVWAQKSRKGGESTRDDEMKSLISWLTVSASTPSSLPT